MNTATSLSSAFMRRLARTPLRRRVVLPARQLSSTAAVLKQRALPPAADPYTPTALAALLARLALPATPALQDALLTCLTHPSFTTHAPPREEGSPEISNNELLAAVGNSLLGLFASEEIATRYPHLPSTALSAAVTSFVGPDALLSVARELGISVQNAHRNTQVFANAPTAIPIRWTRAPYEKKEVEEAATPRYASRGRRGEEEPKRRPQTWNDGVSSVVRAFVGLVYQEQGLNAAREFVHAHFMSRHVDMASLFTFRRPKYVLSNAVSKHLSDAGVPLTEQSLTIESRVLASSGTTTQAPLFNIGLFLSNGLKLAEGHGSSLMMAEHRAATNGLLSLYLVQDTKERVLPTAVHADKPLEAGARGVATSPAETAFVGNPAVGGSESVQGLGRAMRQPL